MRVFTQKRWTLVGRGWKIHEDSKSSWVHNVGCFEICHLGLCGRCCWCPQHHSWDRESTVATIVEQTEAREPGWKPHGAYEHRRAMSQFTEDCRQTDDPTARQRDVCLSNRTPKIIHAAIDSAYSALILCFKGLFPEPREGISKKIHLRTSSCIFWSGFEVPHCGLRGELPVDGDLGIVLVCNLASELSVAPCGRGVNIYRGKNSK